MVACSRGRDPDGPAGGPGAVRVSAHAVPCSGKNFEKLPLVLLSLDEDGGEDDDDGDDAEAGFLHRRVLSSPLSSPPDFRRGELGCPARSASFGSWGRTWCVMDRCGMMARSCAEGLAELAHALGCPTPC